MPGGAQQAAIAKAKKDKAAKSDPPKKEQEPKRSRDEQDKESATKKDEKASKNEKKPETNGAKKEQKDESKQDSNSNSNDTTKATKRSVESSSQPNKRSKSSPPPSSRRTRTNKPSHSSPKQLLTYLLSPTAATLSRPADETSYLDSPPHSNPRTYTTTIPLSPFEELLAAVVLSRPISHRLGLRTLRTVLNPPYSFTSARAIEDAGEEKVREALDEAKTQHKGKTVTELLGLAEVVLGEFGGGGDKEGKNLGKVLGRDDVEEVLGEVSSKVKGVGKTGMEIFRRRVQVEWKAAFPFVDGRSEEALEKIGLPADAEGLRKVIEEEFGKKGEEEVRKAFVVVLERVTGLELEGKMDEAVEAASKGD